MAEHSAGHHSSPDDEYAFTPEGAAYEHTDAAVGPVGKFLFWLFIAAILTHFGLAGVYKLMIDQGVKSEATERRYPLAAGEEQQLPPVPRLQQFPRNELYTFRTEERDRLESYGWENKAAGTVHIPIHELPARLAELSGDRQVWVHCAAGYRAAIAASLLHRAGRAVVAINDDYTAAHTAGLPIVVQAA